VLSSIDTLFNNFSSNFSFLPEYHLEADISVYFLQKYNSEPIFVQKYYTERYFVENNTKLEFIFLSFKDRLHSTWEFDLHTGMGKTPGNVVFDPKDINFGIIPAIEYRLHFANIQAGLDHRCFHEIDRKDFKTVYYNKLMFGATSPNMRQSDYRHNLQDLSTWTIDNRLSWSARCGLYMTDFFGLVSPGKLNGENTRIWDIRVDSRYAFYHRHSWIVNFRLNGTCGYDNDSTFISEHKGFFWVLEPGIESNFRRGKNGGMFFVTFIIDRLKHYEELPRFSRNGLLNFGVRFHY
jgi:hypothetical protein